MIVFERSGAENTEAACKIAIEKAIEMDTDIICATTKGDSGIAMCEAAKAMGFPNKVVIVSHAYGSKEAGENAMSEEKRQIIESYGAKIVTTTHVLSGAERAFSEVFKGVYPVEVMAHTLRMICVGLKVCVEISVMALDCGAIPFGKKMVCVGGTRAGLDTVAVITPYHANRILRTHIHGIVCKPE